MSPPEQTQLLWVVLLCSPPVLLAIILAAWREKSQEVDSIRVGNPLLRQGMIPPVREAVHRPLLQLTRMYGAPALRGLVLGLRHIPLHDTAFILRRYQASSDPELQVYSQSILREKQDQLQMTLARLSPASREESPATLASCIETGLAMVSSPLTPTAERDAVVGKLLPQSEIVRVSGMSHPRAVSAAAQVYLLIREVTHADDLIQRLPSDSPLRQSLEVRSKHHAAIQNPPPCLSSQYAVR